MCTVVQFIFTALFGNVPRDGGSSNHLRYVADRGLCNWHSVRQDFFTAGIGARGPARQIYGSILLQLAENKFKQANRQFIKKLIS